MRRGSIQLRESLGTVLRRPEGLLVSTFLFLILVGSALLALPISHAAGHVGLLDAVFTATSAVCVTGLIVVDTGTDFTTFGQGVILVLIQLGGLGIMTFAALVAQLLRGRLSFSSQAALADTFYQREATRALWHSLKWIVALTLGLELLGALLLYLDFRTQTGGHPPAFTAVFHSISAFCNAGFSLYTDSLEGYHTHVLVTTTIVGLIILGGLGHTVLLEAVDRLTGRGKSRGRLPVRWSLNSRVVITTSLVLIVAGTVMLLGFGTPGRDGSWVRALPDAVFQSVTARTAGFNTVDIGGLSRASLLVLVGLMFIGGSPGSCAGGIKTTSLAIGFSYVRAKLRSRSDVALFGRRLDPELIARAAVIGLLAVAWNAAGCLILSALESTSEGPSFESLVFEQVSAFGTVGLSTGITPALSVAGKMWIIASMFVGRLGPLTVALLVLPARALAVRYPEEHVMVG